ncbi:hypothetical protein LCGC14_2273970 [marine sediment metagenome]|uniref:Uncharacterized protein n=1 Tax=marine sediment metagenome TaxID=412755 RepID=A0A0F9FR79_9ZZZZ
MSEKTEMLDLAIKALKANRLKYIHLPNRLFQKNPYPLLKHFPDLTFAYKGKTYMREYGLPGNNKERKVKQFQYMKEWNEQGVNIAMIYSQQDLLKDFEQIGLINGN